jgi:hypothetical protein
MMRRIAPTLLALGLLAAPARADVAVSGLADFIVRNGEEDHSNVTFRGTSNLESSRVRLFFDANVNDDVQFFTQLLLSGYNDAFIYAAYLRFEEVGGSPVNLHVGLIPSTVGNWGPRTYSDRNPLVGVPLLWNAHTTLNPRIAQTTVEELRTTARDNRGLPVLYDNCWNTGVEAWGQAGPLDWSVAALQGSPTSPQRERASDVPTGTARVAWAENPEFVVGVSGWVGPYFTDDSDGLTSGKPEDFLNGGAGVDLAWTHRHLEIHGEAFHTRWEHPDLPTLGATSGYLEAKYKILTRWYAAGRWGFVEPTEVTGSTGEDVQWDYSQRRIEAGVGFRAARRITVKGVVQANTYPDAGELDTTHLLMQLSAGF